MLELESEIGSWTQCYADLPETIEDASKMLEFLGNLIVRNLRDITIMCEP